MLNVTHTLKSRMESGDKLYAAIVGPGNEPRSTVEALKSFGYDLLIIDREHSLVNPETVLDYVRAGKQLEIPIIVRPEENYESWRCFLDSGVSGLMLSMVNTVEEAARAVDKAYFPPLGHRGYGLGMSPFPLDGMDPSSVPHLEMTQYINDNIILWPQTETLQGVSNLRRILALEGVTGTSVGTFDLALDIGGIRQGASRLDMTRSSAVERALLEIAQICREQGKVAAIGGVPPEDMARWSKEGYSVFIFGTVTEGKLEGVRGLLEKTRALIEAQR